MADPRLPFYLKALEEVFPGAARGVEAACTLVAAAERRPDLKAELAGILGGQMVMLEQAVDYLQAHGIVRASAGNISWLDESATLSTARAIRGSPAAMVEELCRSTVNRAMAHYNSPEERQRQAIAKAAEASATGPDIREAEADPAEIALVRQILTAVSRAYGVAESEILRFSNKRGGNLNMFSEERLARLTGGMVCLVAARLGQCSHASIRAVTGRSSDGAIDSATGLALRLLRDDPGNRVYVKEVYRQLEAMGVTLERDLAWAEENVFTRPGRGKTDVEAAPDGLEQEEDSAPELTAHTPVADTFEGFREFGAVMRKPHSPVSPFLEGFQEFGPVMRSSPARPAVDPENPWQQGVPETPLEMVITETLRAAGVQRKDVTGKTFTGAANNQYDELIAFQVGCFAAYHFTPNSVANIAAVFQRPDYSIRSNARTAGKDIEKRLTASTVVLGKVLRGLDERVAAGKFEFSFSSPEIRAWVEDFRVFMGSAEYQALVERDTARRLRKKGATALPETTEPVEPLQPLGEAEVTPLGTVDLTMIAERVKFLSETILGITGQDPSLLKALQDALVRAVQGHGPTLDKVSQLEDVLKRLGYPPERPDAGEKPQLRVVSGRED